MSNEESIGKKRKKGIAMSNEESIGKKRKKGNSN